MRLNFWQFEPEVNYKTLAYKKKVYIGTKTYRSGAQLVDRYCDPQVGTKLPTWDQYLLIKIATPDKDGD